MSEQTIPIPGRLKNVAIGGHVAGSEDIDAGGGKTQKQVNDETNDTLALHQSEISGLNSQNYVSVSSYSSLPATGSADTIYRVSSYDGTQVDATKYTEYAWNGTTYIVVSVKTQIGEVFDISEYKAVGGTLATFENLSAALDNGNNIPVGVRKGGMSVKFVQSSDNKYVQYRLMSQNFNTTEDNWAFTEGDIYTDNPEWINVITDTTNKVLEGISRRGKKIINLLLEIPAISIKGFLFSTSNNPEYIELFIDKKNRILEGLKRNGTKIIYSIQSYLLNVDKLKVNKEVSLSPEVTEELRVLINRKKEVLVDKDGNGDFTSLIAACLDAQNYDKYTIYVNSGVYDIAQEYMNMFGASYFDNYAENYNGYIHGRIDAGLFLFPNVSLIGIGLVEITFTYTGNNVNVRTYFSLLNTTRNNVVENLTLETTMNNPNRYIIHDDYAGVDGVGTNEFKNLIMDAGNCSAIMGCGMGIANTYIVDNCLLIGNSNIPSISYHNCSNPNYLQAKNKLIIKDCKGVGDCVVIPIGPSQEMTMCIVSNSEFVKIRKDTSSELYEYDNMELVKYNNTEINA